jgi:hypothetical protein
MKEKIEIDKIEKGIGAVTGGEVKQTINIHQYPSENKKSNGLFYFLILLTLVGAGGFYWYSLDGSQPVESVETSKKVLKEETINEKIQNVEKPSIVKVNEVSREKEEKVEDTQVVKKEESKLLQSETSSCKDGKNGTRICYPINQKITVYPIGSNK